MSFELVSNYSPKGDQPEAIEALTKGFRSSSRQTLLGVTGSGKTFTAANLIKNIGLPTLVISHNKTLAAQLYREFKDFFPHNAVEYFVSYYDYYQPEAYIPVTDTYIEKDAAINDELDKLRLRSTSALMSRDDVIVVASVSCIYNLGSPREYRELLFALKKGETISRDDILRGLLDIQYERNDIELKRKFFRVKGELIDVFPAYAELPYRIQLCDDKVVKISEIDFITGDTVSELDKFLLYPAKHFVATEERINLAVLSIEDELEIRLGELKNEDKILEYQRLLSRTKYDIEMLKEVGYCHGIENYSRHLSGGLPGVRPWCLLDYFPKDFLLIIDESHVSIPQVRGMYNGDRTRKQTLVDHGFRLPSCLDNRPLKFDEFESLLSKVLYVSATPSKYEIEKSDRRVAEQVIRPTGLLDPEIEVKSTDSQIEDLIFQIKNRAKKNERSLITTLTKKMAEDLSSYLSELGIEVTYLHSEIDTIKRVEVLKDLRLKKIDVIVGVNLLREGLDLPEVSLVAILDADKEGFLRSGTSLIQVAGRAARNINGKVIMYADKITESMRFAISETERRRAIQLGYNRKYNIKPKTIKKAIADYLDFYNDSRQVVREAAGERGELELQFLIAELYNEMEEAARNLHFEKAVKIRDLISSLKDKNNISEDEILKILKDIAGKKNVKKIRSNRDKKKD
ncbi:MAG: excinuclease ABC subunit UvrB [Candidatus Kaelpia aquatica]|nr:excinuclease ABC subunit UvrB [Candidatus Kaelpia aquatica]